MFNVKSGCLLTTGILIAVSGAVVLLISIFGMIWTENKMDQNREMYSQSRMEIDEYYDDTVRVARYEEILLEMDSVYQTGDSVLYEQLKDSLEIYSPPEARGHIGFNIAGAFLLIPAIVGGILLCIGAIIILIALIARKR